MIENFDAIFYYDKEKFNEQIAEEAGYKKGKTAGIEIGKNVGMVIGKKETILKMLNSGMPELDILKYLGITKSDLEEIKKYK